ncbi:hypothetical protein HQ529_02225 [Candidatus Woesearchaeota archaeon]|nr:hypothetical protein [Candidatus Woesearchaeota archaeon]
MFLDEKDMLVEKVKELYGETVDILNSIKSNKFTDMNNINKNWGVYSFILEKDYIAKYFSEDLYNKAEKLLEKWQEHVNQTQKTAFINNKTVIDSNFPWYEELDLHENIIKILTDEEKNRHNSKHKIIDGDVEGLAQKEFETELMRNQKTLNIYRRKKDIEKQMIEYLMPSA